VCLSAFLTLLSLSTAGHLVSGFVKQHLPILLVQHLTSGSGLKEALTSGFLEVDAGLASSNVDCEFSGSTCSLAYLKVGVRVQGVLAGCARVWPGRCASVLRSVLAGAEIVCGSTWWLRQVSGGSTQGVGVRLCWMFAILQVNACLMMFQQTATHA
jgi:hypothetical protein